MEIPCIYDMIFGFEEGLAVIKQNGKWGFINKKGKLEIPCIYEYVNSFKEGLARVEQDGKRGYINTKGVEYWED